MQRNLKFKAAFIVAVILVCIYGVIGLPKSKDELIANWHKNIRLGLDLRGGTHLVYQVQLQDAFKADADAAIERMKDSTRQLGIDYTSIDHNDPNRIEDADKIEIDVKGVPIAKAAAFRGMVNDQFSDWILTALNSTDYKLNIKQSEALRLKGDTIAQTIATIERKINGLGLAETTVVPTGRSSAEAELLVEMPGVDDPVLSGGSSQLVLNIASAAYVTISGVTVEDGSADGGPAGINDSAGGTLTVNGSNFTDNEGNNGGAIGIGVGTGGTGTATVTGSSFSGNFANWGGAINVGDVLAFGFGQQEVDGYVVEDRQPLEPRHRDGALAPLVGAENGCLELLS